MYYSIYYTTELMKSAIGAEVISGHIYTGILSCSSFVSTNIFIHRFSDKNSKFYKICEIITILFTFHMAYSFFWTSFIYHSVFDSIASLLLGVVISFWVQWGDGLWYFEIYEHTVTHAARFMVSKVKNCIVELIDMLLGNTDFIHDQILPWAGDLYSAYR